MKHPEMLLFNFETASFLIQIAAFTGMRGRNGKSCLKIVAQRKGDRHIIYRTEAGD